MYTLYLAFGLQRCQQEDGYQFMDVVVHSDVDMAQLAQTGALCHIVNPSPGQRNT